MREERTSTPWPKFQQRTIEADLRIDGAGIQGGSGVVYRLYGRLDVVYKKYTIKRSEDDLARLVKMAHNLGEDDISFVRQHFAWPLSIVTAIDGGVAGVLIARVPQAFEAALVTQRVRVRDFNYLLYEARAARVGVAPATRREKLELLDDLARALDWLRRRELVHEDIAAHNVLWRREDGVGTLLLDCDSLRPVSSVVEEPLLTSIDWTDPRILRGDITRPDQSSTVYALGLLTGRVLVEPSWRPAVSNRDNLPADRVPSALAPIIRESVRIHLPRPSIAQWREAISVAMRELAPKSAASMDIDPRAVTNKTPEPLKIEGPGADFWNRVAFAVGLLLGVGAAISLLLGLL